MTGFIKKYKAFVLGAIVAALFIIVLESFSVIMINRDAWLENSLLYIFWWLLISALIYKLPTIRKRKKLAIKILSLSVILVLMIVVDSFFKIRDNPATMVLMVVFWLGLTHIISPGFFKKYKIPLLLVYGIVLSYFLYARLGDQYFEVHKERIVYFLLVPIPLFILLWMFEQWKWIKSLENDKKTAELALLKSQINPHFFFNTLNNLYGLAVEKSDDAPGVVLKLSDMMRYTIYEGKQDVVAVTDEITYLQNYIDLHKIRYRKNVNITFDHQAENHIKTAPLLFIILLENAFKHGIESLADDAYIRIDLKAVDHRVQFIIENNFEASHNHQNDGIGLENLRQRLRLIYPDKHQLEIRKENNIFRVRLDIDIL